MSIYNTIQVKRASNGSCPIIYRSMSSVLFAMIFISSSSMSPAFCMLHFFSDHSSSTFLATSTTSTPLLSCFSQSASAMSARLLQIHLIYFLLHFLVFIHRLFLISRLFPPPQLPPSRFSRFSISPLSPSVPLSSNNFSLLIGFPLVLLLPFIFL